MLQRSQLSGGCIAENDKAKAGLSSSTGFCFGSSLPFWLGRLVCATRWSFSGLGSRASRWGIGRRRRVGRYRRVRRDGRIGRCGRERVGWGWCMSWRGRSRGRVGGCRRLSRRVGYSRRWWEDLDFDFQLGFFPRIEHYLEGVGLGLCGANFL